MSKINVLIVEDDPMVVEVNKGFVNAIPGFTVAGVAKNGYEAIQLAQEFKPELALLDVYLPDKDGILVLKEYRQMGLDIDAILLTAADNIETIQNAFRYGAIDYIIKPFKFSRLRSSFELFIHLKKFLKRTDCHEQKALDRILMPDKSGEQKLVPKGFHDITVKQVLMKLLKEKKAMSSEEVADDLGIARATARRYLEYLQNCGKVKMEIQYGNVGRPVNRYIITTLESN